MQLGMIGLGRMGAGMTKRLLRAGHEVVAYDRSPDATARVVAKGARGAGTLADLVDRLAPPRAVWVMVPAGDPVQATLDALASLLGRGDVVVDGGNSRYTDTFRRAATLREQGLDLLDAGTSGGVWGLAEGYCLMIGGAGPAVDRLRPVFEALAPTPTTGWGRVGPSGAGHFVKMIHNGIEYGLMQAYAEGFAILKRKESFGLDLAAIAEIWRHGSVIRSWLLDLAARALSADAGLEQVAPFVPDSGEGRWTVAEAIDLDVAAPVTALALLARLRSRDEESFSDRMLAALRDQFGGHGVREAAP